MLKASRIGAVVPVSDLERGIEFYGQTLGLGEPERDDITDNPGARFQIGAGGELYLYKSVGAGQSRHTLCAFEVEDIESEVEDLRSRGVAIEEYDMPGMKTENGVIDLGGGVKGAFFKDPDGNILGLGQRAGVGAAV
jgi:catechol 2,3-dioxygenase-like lactoylglutathione lyase family enzyme